MEAAAAIELQGIQKSFGNVHAVRGVSLRIEKGAITGIVGENGAGKSTLMSILYGLYHADAGEIRVDGARGPHGKPARCHRPRHRHGPPAFHAGRHLHRAGEPGAGRRGRRRCWRGGLAAARAELARLAREYGLSVDPDALVADLSVGEQQRVEILKVLFRGARILILDEPSAVLTPQETDQLFRILATLKARGVTVVLITHKLREIMAATDHVYVMRQGQIVADRRTAETSPEELAELMVGRKVLTAARQGAEAAGRRAAASRASDPDRRARRAAARRCRAGTAGRRDRGHRRRLGQRPDRAAAGAVGHPRADRRPADGVRPG